MPISTPRQRCPLSCHLILHVVSGVCSAPRSLVELPHELQLAVFSHLDAPELNVLATTSHEVAVTVAGADELWCTQVLQRYSTIRSLLPVDTLTPRTTWAALYRALASPNCPGTYVGHRHFLSQRRVAQWVRKSDSLSKDEIRLLSRHTMPCKLAFLRSPAAANRMLRGMPTDEREHLLRTGELALDFYEAPDVCRRLHMRAKRSKVARWRIGKGVELVEHE